MKQLKQLFVPLVILGVLIVALVVYLVAEKIRMDALNAKITPRSIEICQKESIQTMKWFNANGETTVFEFDLYGNLTSATYNDTHFEPSQMSAYAIDDILDNICMFFFDKEIDAPSSTWGEYGLATDSKTIELDKRDGSTIILHCGSTLPNKSGIYVRLNDEEKIYIASSSFYRAGSTQFQDMLGDQVLGINKASVSEVKFERASTGEMMVIRPEEDYDNGLFLESRYTVKEPLERDPSETLINLMDTILSLRVSSFVPIADEDLPSYGLDQPEYTFTIKMDGGETIDLCLSREIAGYYFGYCSNNPYRFRISPDSLIGLNTPFFELIDAYVHREYLDTVNSISAKIGDTTFKMDIMLDSSKSITSEDTVINLDMRNAKVYSSDGDCYALVLFGSICNMRISEVDRDASPELKNPAAEFTITKKDSTSYTISLVARDSETYYCFIDDRYCGFLVDRSVLYKNNGHELNGYGVVDAYNLCNEAIENKDVDGYYDLP